MENDRNSPSTSESQTPTFPPGTEGNFFAGMSGMNPQMAGMNLQGMAGMNPQGMAGMNPQGMGGMTPQMFFQMYNWMSQMGGIMPGAGGMGSMAGMGGMMPAAAGMGSMMPNMAGVGGMMPGTMHNRSPHTPRENVYRPYIDLLSSDSPSTVPETQYAGIETFSFEELGLSPIHETPDEAEPAARARGRGKGKGKARGGGRGKGKGKAPGSSSQTGAEEGYDEEPEKRRIWSVWENVALAKSWVGVVEDPYVGANQYIDRLWHRICEAYGTNKPPGGKHHGPEQCRKQWERLRPKLSRFASLYQNNLRQATSGMSEEDVKQRALSQYPDKALKFKEFDQWEVFLVVKGSPKFSAGVESGWKRTKINASGEYSSSAGSHELPEAEEVAPLPRSDARRRRRPMGQKAAQRMARGSGSGSFEVESEAPQESDHVVARAQLTTNLVRTMHRWHSTTDRAYKRMLKDVIDACRRDLGMPPIDDYGNEIGGGDDGGGSGTGEGELGGGSGTGDGDEDEEE